MRWWCHDKRYDGGEKGGDCVWEDGSGCEMKVVVYIVG